MVKEPGKIKEQFESAIRKRSSDGKTLTEEQFKEYYYDVNACMPVEREEFFVDILIHGFRLLDDRVTVDRLKQMEVTIFQKTRQKTYIKTDEG